MIGWRKGLAICIWILRRAYAVTQDLARAGGEALEVRNRYSEAAQRRGRPRVGRREASHQHHPTRHQRRTSRCTRLPPRPSLCTRERRMRQKRQTRGFRPWRSELVAFVVGLKLLRDNRCDIGLRFRINPFRVACRICRISYGGMKATGLGQNTANPLSVNREHALKNATIDATSVPTNVAMTADTDDLMPRPKRRSEVRLQPATLQSYWTSRKEDSDASSLYGLPPSGRCAIDERLSGASRSGCRGTFRNIRNGLFRHHDHIPTASLAKAAQDGARRRDA